jgi:hypothetical protein
MRGGERREEGKKRDPEELFRIIELCRRVEKRGIDPFEMDVARTIEKLRRYLPRWRLLEELLLDAEALSRVTRIIQLQEEWLKHRSSSLYVDPLLVELKVRLLEEERLARIFLQSWHPVASLDRLSSQRLLEGMDYWNLLPSREERLGEGGLPEGGSGGEEEAPEEFRIFSETEFQVLLRGILEDLKGRAGENGGRVPYRDFIRGETFGTTVERAYLLSFLVTDGTVDLEVDPLEEEISLRPRERPLPLEERKKVVSIPIALDPEGGGPDGR